MAGELLKRRREELGLDLRKTAELLKIKADHLASIEEDQFEKLPVAVYTIGYIRCYAAYLEIDPEPVIAFYTGHLIQPKPSTIIPVASSKKKMPLHYYLIPAFLLILLALGAVILMQAGSVIEKHIAAAPTPGRNVQPVQAPEQVAPAALGSDQPVPRAQAAPQDMKPQVAGEHSLEIVAHALTWMHIRFSDGTFEEAMLDPGMTRRWHFTDKAVLKLGNAGGVKLNLDGRNIGSPGSPGQVMTLVFPENQQTGRQGE